MGGKLWSDGFYVRKEKEYTQLLKQEQLNFFV